MYENRAQILEGIFQTAAQSRVWSRLAGIFLACVTAIAAVAGISLVVRMPETGMVLIFLVLFLLARALYRAIFNEVRVKREKKRFLKQDRLMVNGATVIAAEQDRLLYIEDDFTQEDGKPYLIEYPVRFTDRGFSKGERMLVLYDGGMGFQLMRISDELKGIVPQASPLYPLAEKMEEYTCLPHPVAAELDREERRLSEGEKEKYAALYTEVTQRQAVRRFWTGGIGLVAALSLLCILLDSVEDGIPLAQSAPIAAGICAGLAALMCVSLKLGKRKLKRAAHQFETVKEVLFHSCRVDGQSAGVSVYEWIDGRMCREEYEGADVPLRTAYGSRLYKFTDEKGKTVLTVQS